MKPRPFLYLRPDTIDEAVEALAKHGDDARVLAGGQTLIAMLNLRLVEASVIVDISRIAELSTLKRVGDSVEVGAAVTQNRLLSMPGLASAVPLLAQMLPFVGHFQTRNKGTVCGSIAHADPSSELPLALALLEGEVVLRGPRGTRTLKAAAFQRGLLSTARASDELIVAVRFPSTSEGTAFREVARRHGDFAILSVAALAQRDGTVRVGVGGIADRPAVRRFVSVGARDLSEEIDAFAWELKGYDDIHATPRFRRDLLRRLAPSVIAEAISCNA